ncbi:MAG: hypothetical protein IZT55_04230 [Anaerolineae bacterium]|nr:hypothetical protein [Anaerolineae bacterium]
MEIKSFFKTLFKHWWILLLSLLIVVVATWFWTKQQDYVYQSKATFVLRPRSADLAVDDDFVKALDMVSRRVEINTTFAEVSTSRLIKERAFENLGSDATKLKQFSVDAGVVGGTNVLQITVEGPTPAITQEFCSLVGIETLTYVSELYDVFELQPLDPASLSARSIRPNLTLNLFLGAVLGLALGVGAVVLVEFIRTPYEEPNTFNIIHRETGAYNKSYFTLRLWQELHRAKRNKYPLSLALIKIELDGDNISTRDYLETMRVFKKLADSAMREDDILACIDGKIFAVLCPFMGKKDARIFVGNMKEKFASVAKDVLAANGGGQVMSFSSVETYRGGFISEARLLEKGILALDESGTNMAGNNKN